MPTWILQVNTNELKKKQAEASENSAPFSCSTLKLEASHRHTTTDCPWEKSVINVHSLGTGNRVLYVAATMKGE